MVPKTTLPPHILPDILEHLSPSPGPIIDGHGMTSDLTPTEVWERRIRQKTLYRLALVSREVSTFALDALWRQVDDFGNMLSLFPSYDRGEQMFLDCVSDVDWTRFQTYAVRVRGLHLADIDEFHSNVWAILSRLTSPDKPLLPKLERLTGLVISALTICYTFLLSPTIRELELKMRKSAAKGVVNMAMETVQSTLSTIHRLTINDETDFSYIHSGSNRDWNRPPVVQFWTMTQLHTLKVVQPLIALTAAQLEAIASFPNLWSLDLNLESMPEIDARPKSGFARLRCLSLSGPFGYIAQFVQATSIPVLESLTISSSFGCPPTTPPDADSGGLMESMFFALPASIERLYLEVISGNHRQSYLMNPSRFFGSFRGFIALRHLEIAFKTPLSLSDEVLYSLRDAWPELRRFKVTGCSTDTRHRPDEYRVVGPDRRPIWPQHRSSQLSIESDSPMLSTVAAFAHGHPRLKFFEVPALDLEALPDLDTVPILDHGLREFRVGELPANAPLFNYALILDLLFPRLDLSNAQRAVASSAGADISHVSLILLGLQAGRAGMHWERAKRLGEYDGNTVRVPRSVRISRTAGLHQARTIMGGRAGVRHGNFLRSVRSPNTSLFTANQLPAARDG
ncbi:hypothetical protein BN946_scf184936.g6 [Trametes cinnabarina]|uniref:F-box domain-containing protein n=1 Tax=Pycnoporus cinnabarinus TaxID=5643 RepID=A0A060STV3_PYCCI|nr:hypothetical protein BN946_scf184936.g6 [Trametes cinnabarina]